MTERYNRALLEARLQPVLESLRRAALVNRLTESTEKGERKGLVQSVTYRQQLTELANRLQKLHPAEVADLLERLPGEQRHLILHHTAAARRGAVLWELPDVLAAELLTTMTPEDRQALAPSLDGEQLADLHSYLSPALLAELSPHLNAAVRAQWQSAATYRTDQIGHLTDEDVLWVPENATVNSALARLREVGLASGGRLPPQTDQVFVLDDRRRFCGSVPLTALLLNSGDMAIDTLMQRDGPRFDPNGAAELAVRAFEDYDLISAPVIDETDRLIGRITVESVMDYANEYADQQNRLRDGINPNEDLFSPMWKSAKSRWLWLGINLMTAFLASRFIGLFEAAITQLVALATLMPIVASIGGNTGNQTIALFIRGFALNRINQQNLPYLIRKELSVSLINGLIWGTVLGLFGFLLYGDAPLGLVLGVATALNLLIAAVVGMGVPLLMNYLGRDPALGSSILLTFSTDSMGFFIFLGLAQLFLIHP